MPTSCSAWATRCERSACTPGHVARISALVTPRAAGSRSRTALTSQCGSLATRASVPSPNMRGMVLGVRLLLLHGYMGSGPEHWQPWLAERVRSEGHDVAFPTLPDPEHPRLGPWLSALAELRTGGEVVVCHSLACCLWLHHRARGGPPAERVLLVAPPHPEPMLDELASFFPVPL